MTFTLDTAAFEAWLAGYKSAWEQRNPEAAAALFTEDATYRETPYDEPFEGRPAIAAYWARVTPGQQDVRFTSEVLTCSGDRGLCRWHATFTVVADGSTIDLDGIFHCRFASAALVAMFEEWWHIKVTPASAA